MSDSNVRFSTEESDAFIERLKSIISTESLSSFAKRCGFGESLLRKYLNGAVPGIDKAIAIAEKNGRTVEWLLTGDWPEYKSDLRRALEYASVDPSEIIKNFTGIDIVNKESPALVLPIDRKDVLKQNQDDYSHTLYIEHYPDVRAAAGSGQVAPTDQVMVRVAINADEWRRRFGLNHKNIKLITVYGDSMKPTLSHGDQVFVDISCTGFIDDAIYAVQQGELTRIKRIKLRFDGSIEVRSDNEKNGFNPETYNKLEAADFHVIGRVIPYKFGKFEI